MKLSEWWLNVLTADERKLFYDIDSAAGTNCYQLITGDGKSSKLVKNFSILLGYLKNSSERHLAYKIIDKGEQLMTEKTDVIDRHFFYQAKMQVYYKNRDEDLFAFDKAIEACNQQIELSESVLAVYPYPIIPTHAGFKQLCIIREKQGNYEEVIKLAKTAEEHGWSGDWLKRIEKCKKKIEKL